MDSFPGAVTDFVFSDRNTDSEATVMWNGNRIYISISASDLQDSPIIKDQYLHFLQVAEAYEIDGITIDDFYEWLLEGCATELLHLPQASSHANLTLDDYIYPPTFHYTLHATRNNEFALLEKAGTPDELPLEVEIPEALCSSWPAFLPSEVEIQSETHEKATLSAPPRKVLVNGIDVRFFKPCRRCDAALAQHELLKYRQIKEADLRDIQICRLLGLVRDTAGTVFGLLLSLINAKSLTLTCAIRPDTPAYLRSQWTHQITSTLLSLHNAGIVWGDVKPDNVLIDSSKDAWIIDFGGGYTQGWVEEDVSGTTQGDLQGLSRVVKYISQ